MNDKTQDITKEICNIVYNYRSYLISKVQYQLNLYSCAHCL